MADNGPQEQWLTAAETADMLGVSLGTLYKWRSRGLFGGGPPAFKPGPESKVLRYRLADVQRWIDDRVGP